MDSECKSGGCDFQIHTSRHSIQPKADKKRVSLRLYPQGSKDPVSMASVFGIVIMIWVFYFNIEVLGPLGYCSLTTSLPMYDCQTRAGAIEILLRITLTRKLLMPHLNFECQIAQI